MTHDPFQLTVCGLLGIETVRLGAWLARRLFQPRWEFQLLAFTQENERMRAQVNRLEQALSRVKGV